MKTKIEELKRLAEAANKAHGGLPWQVTMTRTDGGTCYSIRGHSEPGIAVDRSDYWEDDHHPPVDHFGYIQPDYYMDCSPARVDIARHIAAANPAAVLELIAEVDRVTKQRDELLATAKQAVDSIAYAIYNLADKKLEELPAGIIDSTDPVYSGLIAEKFLRAAIAKNGELK